MNDDPYKAPATEAVPEQSRVWRLPNMSTPLWILITSLGLILSLVLLMTPGQWETTPIAICATLILLGIAGIRLRWGPVIPCMIIGGVFAIWSTPGTAAISEFPGLLLTGILVGGAVGHFLDARRKLPEGS